MFLRRSAAFSTQNDGEIQRQIALPNNKRSTTTTKPNKKPDERKRMRRIHHERRQHWKNETLKKQLHLTLLRFLFSSKTQNSQSKNNCHQPTTLDGQQ